jgi:hypothetical protein
VHEECPALCRHARLAQRFDRLVEGVGYVVDIERLLLEQGLVQRSCDYRSVLVVHEPAIHHFSQVTFALRCSQYSSPHSANNASEAAKEHGRCQMNGLVGCVPIALGGLASTQNGKNRILEVKIHDVSDREIAVLQNNSTLQRIGSMNPMAGQVKDVSWVFLQQKA